MIITYGWHILQYNNQLGGIPVSMNCIYFVGLYGIWLSVLDATDSYERVESPVDCLYVDLILI